MVPDPEHLTWIRCLANLHSSEVKGEDFFCLLSSCSLMERLKRNSIALIHMCIAVQLYASISGSLISGMLDTLLEVNTLNLSKI